MRAAIFISALLAFLLCLKTGLMMIGDQLLVKLTNVALRVASLAAKLILTLYLGRYLGLADLGTYGLVFAVATIASAALGGRLDHVVARDLVGADDVTAPHLIRDQVVFCAINYVVFALLLGLAYLLNMADAKILLIVFVIAVFGNLSNAMTTNLVALRHPLLSTALFFLRAGLWCLIVVAMGLIWPVYRTVDAVLTAWALGEILAVALNFWVWRKWPWGDIFRTPVDWKRLWAAQKVCFPIWFGTMGAMGASSVDRFVVSYYLDMEKVGIITFYGSFAAALLSLVQSGFFAFTHPRLIAAHRRGDTKAFWHETATTGWQVGLFVFLMACALGLVIPLSAPLFNKPQLAAEALTLWLLLGSVWLMAIADTFHYVLYAQKKDRALWLGMFLSLIPATLGNIVFIPLVGLEGVGVSAILASLFLLAWRIWFSFKPARK